MADHHDPAVPASNHIGDKRPRLRIQMVGRLIQQDQVGPSQHQARQSQPRLLATAEIRRQTIQRQARQSDSVERLAGACFQRPVGIRQIALARLTGQDARNDRHGLVDAQRLGHRFAGRRIVSLVQDPDRAATRHNALHRRSLARNQAQQSALAGAIATDDAGAL